MAKAPADTIKYNIRAEIRVDGVVEKPDVVGAVFGQSEGLLGEDLELRDLQKTGRVGRIEVELETKLGKSVGKLLVPSSLDMVETSIIAATVESVDRVGPCNAKIRVLDIEDARVSKRKIVIDRAKELLKKMMAEEIPESERLTDEVKKAVQLSEISSYQGLPAGPAIEKADSVILVEGRADVLNLLKSGIKNVVAVGGTNIPKPIVEITKVKTAIAFLDGDRGGEIILKELSQIADIDYVARTPRGKEVEDLGKKEIIMALRRKAPLSQIKATGTSGGNARTGGVGGVIKKPSSGKNSGSHPKQSTNQGKEETALLSMLSEVKGKLNARLYDGKINIITEIEIKDLINTLKDVQPAYIVLDGIITQRLIDVASESSVKCIVGMSKSSISNPRGIRILTETS